MPSFALASALAQAAVMKRFFAPALAASAFAFPLAAQEAPEGAPSPNQIVDEANAGEWTAVAPDDLLVMTLAPDAQGNRREVVIQLMPAPFSQGWVENIRTLARARWYDDITVNRVQDNYVVQWGDPNYDNPEAEGEAKPLPEGLKVMGEDEYVIARNIPRPRDIDPCVRPAKRHFAVDQLSSRVPGCRPRNSGFG